MVRIHCGGCWGRVGLNCGVFWVKNRGLAWFASRDRMVALWGHNFVNLASVWAVHTFEHLVYLSACCGWGVHYMLLYGLIGKGGSGSGSLVLNCLPKYILYSLQS